jgi:HK97 family phage portal protein
MCPGDHWWMNEETNGRERVTTSALCRILRKPNDYESISDFLLNAVRDLYQSGNAYALALRNSRFEISEIHLMNPYMSAPHVSPETGDVFYSLGGNEVVDYKLKVYPLVVPSRDVLHLRLNTNDYNMLLGQSPIVAAARDLAAGDAMMNQQINFYLNQARPSAVLTTDLQLDPTQVQELRDRWDEVSRGMNAGKTPILTSGVKPVPWGANANDSQLADVLKMSRENIAIAFRVPLQILGLGSAGPTEALMQTWLNQSLGFCLNHIEEAFDDLFGLKGYPAEYTEFSTDVLLRSSMKERVESFARGVQSGIWAPDEARAEFGLKKVKGGFGEEPRVQQQLVPLSAAAGIPSAPPSPGPPAAPPAPKDNANADATKADRARARRRFRTSHSRQLSI